MSPIMVTHNLVDLEWLKKSMNFMRKTRLPRLGPGLDETSAIIMIQKIRFKEQP